MNRQYILLFILVAACLAACRKNTRSEADGNDFFTAVDTTEEITLPTVSGNGGGEMSIEKLKGNVVIMDVLYSTPEKNDKHIATLRSLYDKYSSQGLEIYQVCMDTVPERWSAMAKTLPWIAVYDDNTLKSKLLAKYKVLTIPSMQLFNRDGQKISASVTSDNIEPTIAAALKATSAQ